MQTYANALDPQQSPGDSGGMIGQQNNTGPQDTEKRQDAASTVEDISEMGTGRREDAEGRQAKTSAPLAGAALPPRASPLSTLQRLERERQEELFRYDEAVRRFRRWFHRLRQHEDNMALTQDIIEMRRKNEPDISEEELALFGRKVFARLAIDAEDGPEWARQQLVRQREIKLELEQARIRLARQKFEFDAAEACVKHFPVIRMTVNNSGLSEPEKIERVQGVLFPKPAAMTNGK